MLSRHMNGLFAINKPSGPTSNEILTKLKEYFSSTAVFAPQIKQQQQNLNPKQRNFKKKNKFVKIGHGGTLDPLASGVLVIGVGTGTKRLGEMLGHCTKTYKATALFGTSTTTYDSEGSVVKRSSTAHLTDEKVASVLDQFRGKIMQTPPVYSALKMNGKRLYEYARSGEELPKEIQQRECQIDQFDVVGSLQWEHEYKHPEMEASDQEKEYARILNNMHTEQTQSKEKGDEEDGEVVDNKEDEGKGPILEIEFTVSSGTYIRSLIHDLGLALGTTAHMVKLTRTVQSDWKLGKNVFEVDDFLKRDETEWESELRHYLDNGPNTELSKLRTKSDES